MIFWFRDRVSEQLIVFWCNRLFVPVVSLDSDKLRGFWDTSLGGELLLVAVVAVEFTVIDIDDDEEFVDRFSCEDACHKSIFEKKISYLVTYTFNFEKRKFSQRLSTHL